MEKILCYKPIYKRRFLPPVQTNVMFLKYQSDSNPVNLRPGDDVTIFVNVQVSADDRVGARQWQGLERGEEERGVAVNVDVSPDVCGQIPLGQPFLSDDELVVGRIDVVAEPVPLAVDDGGAVGLLEESGDAIEPFA